MTVYSAMRKRVGLAKESVRGTAEAAPTKWIAVSPDSSIKFDLNLLEDKTLRGVMAKYPPAPGQKNVMGNLKFPLRASDIGELLHMLCGDPTSTEQTAALVTSSSNDKINFTEDGGAEKTATLTAGSYAYGTASSQAGTLCAEIKTQLEAANETAATYTVTYSYSTKKFTITKNSGVFVLKWSTGTHAATSARTLLGFTAADTSSAIAATSDSTTGQWIFQHRFTPISVTQPQAYTVFFDHDLAVKAYNGCNVSEIKLTRSPNDFILFDAQVHGRNEASGSIGSPSYSESEEMTFQHDTVSIASSSNTQIKNWDISLKNGLLRQRTTSQSQTVNDLLATEFTANGSFTVYFENETERDKFVAGSSTSLQFTIAGDTIANSIKYTLDILCDEVYYTAFPFDAEDNLLAAKVAWNAVYSTSNSRIFKVDLKNIKSSY